MFGSKKKKEKDQNHHHHNGSKETTETSTTTTTSTSTSPQSSVGSYSSSRSSKEDYSSNSSNSKINGSSSSLSNNHHVGIHVTVTDSPPGSSPIDADHISNKISSSPKRTVLGTSQSSIELTTPTKGEPTKVERPRSNSVVATNVVAAVSPKSPSFAPLKASDLGNAKGLVEFLEEPEKPKDKSKDDKRKSRSKNSFFKEYSKSATQFATDNELSPDVHKHEERRMASRSDSVVTPKKSKDKSDSHSDEQHEFIQSFHEVPRSENLITYYSCSLNAGKQGRMYISENYICFQTNDTKVVISSGEVLHMEKLSVKLLPAIEIITPSNEFLFTHLFSRDNAFKVLKKLFGPQMENNRSIYNAVMGQDIQRLRALLGNSKFSVNILEPGEHGDLPLHAAIKTRNIQVIDLVLKYYKENNLDINKKDNFGWTYLHQAVSNCVGKNVEDTVLKMLLDFSGIQVNAVNSDNNSVLHYFAQNFCSPSCQELGEILIKRGAQVNALNKNNETPLHKAVFNNSVRILMVDLLIKNGADVTIVNTENLSVLHYAVLLGRRDLLKILLHAGGIKSLSIRSNKDHKTPYELAIHTKQEKIAETLKKVQDLLDWLNAIELGDLVLSFMKEDLYLEVLSDVDESYVDTILNNLKVETTGSRIRLGKAIAGLIEEKRLKGAEEPPQTSPGNSGLGKNLSFKDRLKQAKSKEAPKVEQLLPTSLTSSIQDNWLIKHSDLEYTKKLGSGASGKVYKGLYKGMKVAVKVLKTGNDQDELTRIYKEFKKEFGVMRSPFVVGYLKCNVSLANYESFYGACLEPKICMVMEYCQLGSLYSVLSSKTFVIDWKLGLKFAVEMCIGLRALHTFSPPIYHRLNLLVTEDWTVKLTDFGLARFNTADNLKTFSNVVGTIGYSAPEVLSGLGYTDKSDVWSMGMVLFVRSSFVCPLLKVFQEIIYRVINGTYQRPYEEFGQLADFLVVAKVVENNLTPTLPALCPVSLSDLVKRCWLKEPADRPTVDEMLDVLQGLELQYQQNPDQWEHLYNK